MPTKVKNPANKAKGGGVVTASGLKPRGGKILRTPRSLPKLTTPGGRGSKHRYSREEAADIQSVAELISQINAQVQRAASNLSEAVATMKRIEAIS
jgi:hypothetical protein